MELLLVIVAVAAFLLLVKHAKANGRISERTFTSRLARTRLQTSNAKVSDSDLQMQLQELQRFKPIHDVVDEEPHRGGGGATATPHPYSHRCSVQSA